MANAALASRKDARDAVLAARKAFGGWSGRTAYNRGQVLYRVAEVMEDRRPQFVEAAAPVRGRSRAAAGRAGASTRRSTGWSGTPAGPTRSPRSSATPTRSPGRSSTSRRPSRPASSPCSRRRSPACSAWSAWSRPVDRHRQHRRGRVVLRAAAARGHVRRGAGHLRRARRRGQHPHRLARPTIGPWLASHMDVNAIDLTGVAGDAELATDLEVGGGREPQAGTPRPGRRARLDRRPGPRPDDRVPGDQDRLAPDRRLRPGQVRAQVIVLAGPSGPASPGSPNGSGCRCCGSTTSTRTATTRRSPGSTAGANAGLVDWDHPGSWLPRRRARGRSTRLCRDGRADVPVYDIARDGRCGCTRSSTSAARRASWPRGSSPRRSSPPAATRGLLAAAYCVRQHPCVTFWRRLTRDLREHRKPPLVLVRRGLALMRDQRRVVARAVALGCVPGHPGRGLRRAAALADVGPDAVVLRPP